MDSSYITMHEELTKKKQSGPEQMLNVLAFIPQPNNWFVEDNNLVEKDDLGSIFEVGIIEQNIGYLNNIVSDISNLKSIKILENHERIIKEIELLCKGCIKTVEIEILLKIEYERKGSIILKLKDDTILFMAIEYTEYQTHKNLKETKMLLRKIMKISNGFWGTIGVEFDLLDKIDVACLYDSLFMRGFEYSVWNDKIIYSSEELYRRETKIVFGSNFHGYTNREIIHWFLWSNWYWKIKHSEYYLNVKKENFVYKYPLISWFAFCIHSLIKKHRLPLQD
jgi:hypothetical protein